MMRYVNKRLVIFHLLLLAVFPFTAPGQMAPMEVHIKFNGDSTLHGFAGTAGHASITNSRSPDGQDVMEVHVPVRKMKTGNNSRDSRMYRMFHADSHPYITGMMDARHMIDSGVAETVPVSLTICGSSRDVMADISSVVTTSGRTVRRLAFDVSLASFGLTPPAVVGLIRVKDTVHVTADIVAQQ